MFQDRERLADALGDRLRKRRGHHAARGTYKDPVIEMLAQLAQGVAHRWLRDTQFVGRPRNIAMLPHGAKHPQAVQIQRLLIHKLNSSNQVIRIASRRRPRSGLLKAFHHIP
jgi:hypothetical protein